MYTTAIIIPTMDNPEYLLPCLQSMILYRQFEDLFHIFIIDNGKTPARNFIPHEYDPFITIIRENKNLGWEGGLIRGLKEVPKEVEYVLFCNDDVLVPTSSRTWLNDMLQWMKMPEVGAVGPTSNCVMGMQNIFTINAIPFYSSTLLIGFCVLVRKSALEKIGGVDDTLPGGDDFDLSIRLIDAGYKLVIDKNVFIFHHGFKTGERLHGTAKVNNGWNSYEMYQRTTLALIKKHGFKRWQKFMEDMGVDKGILYKYAFEKDKEGEIIRTLINSFHPEKIYELGCGNILTVPTAIGVDMIPKGHKIDSLGENFSVAEIIADVSQELPFRDADCIIARHILEHCIDTIQTLAYWKQGIKEGGRIIIAVPDQDLKGTLAINKEHVHAFTKESLSRLCYIVGFKNIQTLDGENNVSFILEGEV